jgi:hypothetical protein
MQTPAKNLVKRVDLLPSDALLPILECVSNSIISLSQSDLPVEEQRIDVEIIRGERAQGGLIPDDHKPIKNVTVTDNGVGFHEKNFVSFQTPYSDALEDYGCLGVGRFSVLAAFRHMKIRSNFRLNGKWKYREFDFDEVNEVIPVAYEESGENTNETVVEMRDLYNEIIVEKTAVALDEIAKAIMKHFFLYHLSNNLPQIILRESNSEPLNVNALFADVSQEKTRDFNVFNEPFRLYITRNPKTTNRRNHYYQYCADSRVVGRAKYLSNLDSIFSYPLITDHREYFLDVFVVGKYLDERKYTTRNGFRIPATQDQASYDNEITLQDIGQRVAAVLKDEYSDHVKKTQELNILEWQEYIRQNPVFHIILKHAEILQTVPANTKDEHKEGILYSILSDIRRANERSLQAFIDAKSVNEEAIQKVAQEISTKTELNKDCLVDYMIRRKAVIDLFKKFLERDQQTGSYRPEADIHNLIFPKGHDSEETDYEAHNLWLLDERLVAFQFIASDKPIGSYTEIKSRKAGDLVLINNPIGLGDKSNGELGCLVVFEFKRPGDVAGNMTGNHWDFAEATDKYFDAFRFGGRRKKNHKGLPVVVNPNTPKFGYIILSEIPDELARYNQEMKGWKLTAFGTYYKIVDGSHMHLEAMTFDHLIKSVDQRHSPFFDRLFR